MSCCGASADRSVYATGILASGETLAHPGGLALTRRALELAGLPAGARVLDVGCGAGHSMELLHSLGFRALGVDPAAVRPAFLCLRAEAKSLPLPDASFEAVLMECSLSIVGNQRQALRECARVLLPGGRLLVSDLYARAPAAIDQVRGLGSCCMAGMLVREELENWVADAGFCIDLWEDHSAALREFAARFLMAGGEPGELWGCGEAGSGKIAEAMRAVRAGYFLLMATRPLGSGETR